MRERPVCLGPSPGGAQALAVEPPDHRGVHAVQPGQALFVVQRGRPLCGGQRPFWLPGQELGVAGPAQEGHQLAIVVLALVGTRALEVHCRLGRPSFEQGQAAFGGRRETRKAARPHGAAKGGDRGRHGPRLVAVAEAQFDVEQIEAADDLRPLVAHARMDGIGLEQQAPATPQQAQIGIAGPHVAGDEGLPAQVAGRLIGRQGLVVQLEHRRLVG